MAPRHALAQFQDADQVRAITPANSAFSIRLTVYDPRSFLKDLATLRSPQSPFTFLSYLHSQDRLLNFINRGSFTPTRKEYSDYLAWAAAAVQERGIQVRFGEEVIGLNRCDDGTVEVRSRNLETGEEFSRRSSRLLHCARSIDDR